METENKKVKSFDEAIKYLKEVAPHTPVVIPKETMPILPEGFEKTFLGYAKEGESAQYRGTGNIHIHELEDRFIAHRDHFDPRTPEGALGHVFFDTPEIPAAISVGALSGYGIGKLVYEIRKDKSKDAETEAAIASSLAALGFGLLTFFAVRWLK